MRLIVLLIPIIFLTGSTSQCLSRFSSPISPERRPKENIVIGYTSACNTGRHIQEKRQTLLMFPNNPCEGQR